MRLSEVVFADSEALPDRLATIQTTKKRLNMRGYDIKKIKINGAPIAEVKNKPVKKE